MRRTVPGSALLLAAGVVSLACAGEAPDDDARGPDAAEAGEEVESSAGRASGSPSGRALSVDTLPGVGPYLADQGGRPLYILDRDSPGRSTCFDACEDQWPPFLAEPDVPPAGDPSLRSDLIAAFEREENTRQTTYGGRPLYYYVGDAGSGAPRGHGVQDEWGTWSLIGPDGDVPGG